MSRHGPRIAALARRARRDLEAFDPADAAPADAEAYLREGVGPAVWLYVEGRTGGRLVPLSAAEFDALTGAMNRWLELYAGSHGVSIDAAFTLREAAELLVETRNVFDTAQLLTAVPERDVEPGDGSPSGDERAVRSPDDR